MASLRWFLVAFAVVVVALVGGTFLVQHEAIDRLLYEDAVLTGQRWTEYLTRNLADIDAIAAGREPSAASLAFLDQAKRVGQVFLFKLYDAKGGVRYESDTLPETGEDEEGLAEHNSEAAEAIENGRPAIEVKTGEPPTRPPFFSEAYIPYLVNGKVAAVVETYIDQTDKQRAFEAAFFAAAAQLGVLIVAAFGIPAAAWYLGGRARQKADARIHYLDNYDALTGLANRTQLIRRLGRALGGQVGRAAPLAVHAIDLDRFKDVNDTLGHDAGDLVIKTVGERLRAAARPNDIVARLGGDEFAIVQVGHSSQTEAEVYAGNVLLQLTAPYWLNGQEVKLAARVGIALAPDHGTDASRLMKSADLALHKGKNTGGQRVRVFSPDLDEEFYQRISVESMVVRALDSDGFALHYQPIFSLDGGGLMGFEALLRLPMEGGGFVPPTTFIPVAERIGVIDRIGAWVVHRATATAAHWAEHLKVSVNLSPLQFASGDAANVIARALKASQLDPARLEVEITESLLLQDTEAVLHELAAIKSLGAAIVMDDFGTGYSSLNYLWRFPFDRLKIDRSFMAALDAGDPSVRQIVRTIVALGRSLDVRITVEGVENESQATFSREIGCDDVQGFYFGRPAPESDVSRIILADFRRRTSAMEAERPRSSVPRANDVCGALSLASRRHSYLYDSHDDSDAAAVISGIAMTVRDHPTLLRERAAAPRIGQRAAASLATLDAGLLSGTPPIGLGRQLGVIHIAVGRILGGFTPEPMRVSGDRPWSLTMLAEQGLFERHYDAAATAIGDIFTLKIHLDIEQLRSAYEVFMSSLSGSAADTPNFVRLIDAVSRVIASCSSPGIVTYSAMVRERTNRIAGLILEYPTEITALALGAALYAVVVKRVTRSDPSLPLAPLVIENAAALVRRRPLEAAARFRELMQLATPWA